MVSESYAMQPSSHYRLKYSDRPTDRIGRSTINSRELRRLEFLRSSPACYWLTQNESELIGAALEGGRP